MVRKYFAPTPPSVDVRSGMRVSLEEELIIVDQANQSAAVAEITLCEAERLVDLAGALEDLASIADGIKEATPTELDLIDSCAQMAVTGTDIAPDELLKGPQLAVGQSIATEGWKETAQKVWKSIKQFMEKIWAAIDKFFKVHVILPTIYARLDLVLKQLKNRTSKQKYGAQDQFEITTGIQYFSDGRRLQRNANEFLTELGKFAKAVDMVYVQNPKRVISMGQDIAAAIHDWEPADTDDTVSGLIGTLQNFGKENQLAFPLPFKAKHGEFQAAISYEVLGACYFQLTTFEDKSAPALVQLERLRHTGLTLEEGEDPKDTEFTFKHGNAGVYEKMISETQAMLQVVAKFNSGTSKTGFNLGGLRDTKKSIEKASEEAIRDTIRDDSDPIGAQYVRTMLNFNPTFARWVQQPAVPFYSKVIGVARTVIMLVSHFNSLYEVENKEAEAKIIAEMSGAKA